VHVEPYSEKELYKLAYIDPPSEVIKETLSFLLLTISQKTAAQITNTLGPGKAWNTKNGL